MPTIKLPRYDLPTTLKGIRESLTQRPKSSIATPSQETPELTKVDPGKMPVRTDYQRHQNFVDSFLEKPISEEEEAKRKRAASSVGAIGALGNALSAFSNLAFAGDIVPSQELPKMYDVSADVKAFEERTRKAREAYLRSRNNAVAEDQKAFDADREIYSNAVEHNRKVDLEKYRQAKKQQLEDKKLEERKAIEKEKLEVRKGIEKEKLKADRKKEKRRIEEERKRREDARDRQSASNALREREVSLAEKREERYREESESKSKKEKYEVDGDTYDNLQDAYAALPDTEKVPPARTEEDKKQAIADYKRKQKAETEKDKGKGY